MKLLGVPRLCNQSFNVQSKHFFGHGTRIVEIAASSDAPGEIGVDS